MLKNCHRVFPIYSYRLSNMNVNTLLISTNQRYDTEIGFNFDNTSVLDTDSNPTRRSNCHKKSTTMKYIYVLRHINFIMIAEIFRVDINCCQQYTSLYNVFLFLNNIQKYPFSDSSFVRV